MKVKRSILVSYLFLFILLTVVGIIQPARAEQHQEQSIQTSLAKGVAGESLGSATPMKGRAIDETGRPKDPGERKSELFYAVSPTHFEPLLLLVLGTVLLSVTTGIKVVRARKPGMPFHSADQLSIGTTRNFPAASRKSEK